MTRRLLILILLKNVKHKLKTSLINSFNNCVYFKEQPLKKAVPTIFKELFLFYEGFVFSIPTLKETKIC